MDDLDRILGSQRDISPSAGFAGRVMAAVRREAAGPAPIAFPWHRVVPLLVVQGAALGFGLLLWTIVLIRSNASLAAVTQSSAARAMRAAWSCGVPLVMVMLIAGWLVFELSKSRARSSL